MCPLRPLLDKDTNWEWKAEHDTAFNKIKSAIQGITEINHFKRDKPLGIACDANKEGLGAVLQQKTDEGWQAIHFASRFLTTFEQKYFINELDLLAVVWAVENSRNYVYGTSFEIVSDHKALISILKGNRANKSFSSRLTRWVDRLLPFQFTVSHELGRTLGMAGYLSRDPSPNNNNEQLKAEGLWNNWFTVNEFVNRPVLVEQNDRYKRPISDDLANLSETARNSEAASESKLSKPGEQTVRSIIASINSSVSTSKLESSDSEAYDASTVEFASKPPLKTPMCYSIAQTEKLQSLGNYTFAAHFESD